MIIVKYLHVVSSLVTSSINCDTFEFEFLLVNCFVLYLVLHLYIFVYMRASWKISCNTKFCYPL